MSSGAFRSQHGSAAAQLHRSALRRAVDGALYMAEDVGTVIHEQFSGAPPSEARRQLVGISLDACSRCARPMGR